MSEIDLNLFKKVIYFDFTGTLFDPFVRIRSILNSVAREKGYKYYQEFELEKITKVSPVFFIEYIFNP